MHLAFYIKTREKLNFMYTSEYTRDSTCAALGLVLYWVLHSLNAKSVENISSNGGPVTILKDTIHGRYNLEFSLNEPWRCTRSWRCTWWCTLVCICHKNWDLCKDAKEDAFEVKTEFHLKMHMVMRLLVTIQ